MDEPIAPRILIVDDDHALCETLARGLGKRGFTTRTATSGVDALAQIQTEAPDAVLSDVNMRPMSGLELCERVRESRPDVPVILLTAFGSVETAVAALRSGAYDFLQKPIELDLAAHALQRAVELRRLRGELTQLRDDRRGREGPLVGRSAAMQRVLDVIDRVSGSDATVLVTGESGVGKELVARALHERGPRAKGPFVAVNCAALPETLLESELFGHAKGAFTDAREARTGLFVQAHGGTLFLDEVGEMPLGMQAKVLRALQERRVRPVGAGQELPFDARIVCATNRDLGAAVERGTLREDLFYRIAVIELEVPPLRSRPGDVLVLAQHLLEETARRAQKDVRSFEPEVARLLVRYRWPGNVRELSNCIERAVAMARLDRLTVDDLPPRIVELAPSTEDLLVAGDDPEAMVPLEEVEKRYILRVLDSVGGRRQQAAKILRVDRKTLYRKLERWGIGGEDP